MDKIIIIDDSRIKKELEAFLTANKNHIKLSSDMDEFSMGRNTILKEIITRYEEKHKVKIQSMDHVRFYKLNDIVFIKSEQDKILLYQSDSSINSINETIDNIEVQLKCFPLLRIHDEFIVNLYHVVRISGQSENSIELSDGTTLPLSPEKKEIIIESLNKYIK
jgi:two-component system LytT family response regulator